MIKLINKYKSFYLGGCRFYGFNKQGALKSKIVTVATRFAHTGGLNAENNIKNVQKDFNLTGDWISGFSQSPHLKKRCVPFFPLVGVALKYSFIRGYRTTPDKSLTPFQDQVLIGLILGDVFVQQKKPNHSSYLQFKQSFINKDYVDHLYEIFNEFCNGKVKVETYLDKRNNKEYTSARFNTRSFKCFIYYRELFYLNRVKRIPKNIKDLLTPVSLAYWAMDDGTAENKGFKYCTDSFLKEDVILLIEALKDKFSLDCTIREHSPNQYRIYVRVSSMDKFCSLVRPYFHSSMMYKLGAYPLEEQAVPRDNPGAHVGCVSTLGSKKYFSTVSATRISARDIPFHSIPSRSISLMVEKSKFSSQWVSGFVQSTNGCFTITFEKYKTGLYVRPRPIFCLAQDYSEVELFKSLLKYLGVGYLRKNKTNVYLEIKSLSAFKDVVFPILDQHPLKYGKLKAYLILKNIVEEMINKNHLNLEGLLRIIYVSHQLNVETTRRTEESKNELLNFLESKHGKLPAPEKLDINSLIPSTSVQENKLPLTLGFIAGLIDGDGSFNVSFQIKPYRRVRVNFTVVQESSCKELLYELKSYFSCGSVYDLPSAASRFQVENVDLILNNIKPVMDKVILNTYKAESYNIAIKVCEIIRAKGYKTDEALKEIVELAYDSNMSGKRRRASKEEFIRKISDN